MVQTRISSIGLITVLLALSFALGAQPTSAQDRRAETDYVTKATVNVRKGPGTKYEIVAKIPKGTKIRVVGKEGPWLKVESKHDNPPGYIDERFAIVGDDKSAPRAASAPGTYVTTATVNVRSGPGTTYPGVAKIPRNTKVQIVGVEGEWLKVQSKRGNPSGYIHRQYARPLSSG